MFFALPAAALKLDVQEIKHPEFTLQGLSVSLPPEVKTPLLSIKALRWRDWQVEQFTFACPGLRLNAQEINCRRGQLISPIKAQVEFRYHVQRRILNIVLSDPSNYERWQFDLNLHTHPQAFLRVENGSLPRFASFIPADLPMLSKGKLNGQLLFNSKGDQQELNLQSVVSDIAFSDESGLRAGEQIAVEIKASAVGNGKRWRSEMALSWPRGEIFWQPFYLAAGKQQLSMSGVLSDSNLHINQIRLIWPQTATVEADLQLDVATRSLIETQFTAQLDLALLYQAVGKAMLAATSLAALEVQGHAAAKGKWSQARGNEMELQVDSLSLHEPGRDWRITDGSANLLWNEQQTSTGLIQWRSASYGRLPIGALYAPFTVQQNQLRAAEIRLPILQGALTLQNLQGDLSGDNPRWTVNAQLSPIDFAEFSASLGWPSLNGNISADLATLTYAQRTLTTDGVLRLNVFDGSATASTIKLEDPLGPTPRLSGDLSARSLDLELITRAFSFGRMTGRIDAEVNDLELQAWQPVQFSAHIASSAGEYPKKISQRAVQNLTAIGGGSALAAIQQSFLRFFEEFGYRRLGLSCVLQNGVCKMDGIAPAPVGYTIVEGGGIPALSVIGYNRHIDFTELVTRLKRVTQGELNPVIR